MAEDFYAGATRRVMSFLRAQGAEEQLRCLHRPRPWRALGLVVIDWSIMAASCWAVHAISPILTPCSLLLIGWRQRGLGNLLHDGSHGALLPGRRANRIFTMIFCGLPMLEDFDAYRDCHQRHHRYLGDPQRDPDWLEAAPASCTTPLAIYLHQLLRPAMLRTSVLGNIMVTSARGRMLAALWWAGCLGGLTLLGDRTLALTVLALFFAARLTTYHAIRVFSEMCDHVTPSRADVLFEGTRTMPSGWLGRILHPRNDNYHLAHHLFPHVPTFMLDRLDGLLAVVPEYRAAPRYDGYFVGSGALVRSWLTARGHA